jgi:hypothetical protein
MEHKHAFPAQELKLAKIIGGEIAIDGTTYRPFNIAGYGGRFEGKVMCWAVTDDGLAFLWGTADAMAEKQAESEPTHVMIPEEFRTGDWRWWGPEGWIPPAERPLEQTLEDLTKAQLLQLASDQGMDASKMNKAEIIAAIRANEVATEAPAPEPPSDPNADNPDPTKDLPPAP